ncbi:hypothetical protein AgCh_028541 [Apium graveolens]
MGFTKSEAVRIVHDPDEFFKLRESSSKLLNEGDDLIHRLKEKYRDVISDGVYISSNKKGGSQLGALLWSVLLRRRVLRDKSPEDEPLNHLEIDPICDGGVAESWMVEVGTIPSSLQGGIQIQKGNFIVGDFGNSDEDDVFAMESNFDEGDNGNKLKGVHNLKTAEINKEKEVMLSSDEENFVESDRDHLEYITISKVSKAAFAVRKNEGEELIRAQKYIQLLQGAITKNGISVVDEEEMR